MRKLIYLGRIFWGGLFEFARIVFLGVVVPALSLVGLFVFLDVLWLGDSIPQPRELTHLDRLTVSRDPGVDDPNDDEERHMQKMSQALLLLDRSLPAVSDWVRERQGKGKIRYVGEYDDAVAAFDVLARELILTNSFFGHGSYFQADVLAHEYYHSRQGFTVRFMQSLAILTGNKDRQYVESPAYLYGDRVYNAITGTLIKP